jgi:hypothetical protein
VRTVVTCFFILFLTAGSSVFGQAILTNKSDIAIGGSVALVDSDFNDRVTLSAGVAGQGLFEVAFNYTSGGQGLRAFGLGIGVYPLSLGDDSLRLLVGAIGTYTGTAFASAVSIGPAVQASLPIASTLRLIPSLAVAESWLLNDRDMHSTLVQYGLSLAIGQVGPGFWFTTDVAGVSDDSMDPVFTYGFSVFFMPKPKVEDVWDF